MVDGRLSAQFEQEGRERASNPPHAQGHRVLRVARTLADLDGAEKISRLHLAEALSYRATMSDARRDGKNTSAINLICPTRLGK
jgi:Magnesium chelatase, subunit ChlI C-terminal